MIDNMKSFVEKFGKFPGCYTIIGGMACDILMNEADRNFRQTKDVDMILILEAEESKEFAIAFWEYIKEGGYKMGWKNNPDIHFYRFTEPNEGYPLQIELFSRNQGLNIEETSGIIPIHIDDDVSSLSALLLNDDYYDFMLSGKMNSSGVSILAAEYIIPFKMYAWINLKDDKAAGKHVNERDYKKHRLDVFRLLTIADRSNKIICPGRIRSDVERFLNEVDVTDQMLDVADVDITVDEGKDIIQSLYLS